MDMSMHEHHSPSSTLMSTLASAMHHQHSSPVTEMSSMNHGHHMATTTPMAHSHHMAPGTTAAAMSHAGHHAAAQGSEHAGHSDGGSSHGDMLFFDRIFDFKVLFHVWSVEHEWQFALTIIGIFLLAFVYEGLRIFRNLHFQCSGQNMVAALPTKSASKREPITNDPTNDSNSNCCAEACPANSPKPPQTGFISVFHLVQTVLHLLTVSLSYLLMLAVMSFNVWVFVAAMVGLTAGYFAFGHLLKPERGLEIDQGCCA